MGRRLRWFPQRTRRRGKTKTPPWPQGLLKPSLVSYDTSLPLHNDRIDGCKITPHPAATTNQNTVDLQCIEAYPNHHHRTSISITSGSLQTILRTLMAHTAITSSPPHPNLKKVDEHNVYPSKP